MRGGGWEGTVRKGEGSGGKGRDAVGVRLVQENYFHSFLPSLSPANGYFPEYLVVAEAVSALKKTFARILLIVVSSGYGTVM